ncbi:type II toxin-antitoxin system HigB family toxin [Singulisphaera sp. PoT]|uniref:type II toxin-antitoxin system HigB family toxin n=1 Tax=Singulisphaera sp. PoT TaxID=3411797 RepID=UPI003BF61B04
MRVITKVRLKKFWEKHPESEDAMLRFYREARKATWHNYAEIKETFPAADTCGTCYIFDVQGNNYRVIAKIHFPKFNEKLKRWEQGRVYIRAVMTHAEYAKDRWKRDCRG